MILYILGGFIIANVCFTVYYYYKTERLLELQAFEIKHMSARIKENAHERLTLLSELCQIITTCDRCKEGVRGWIKRGNS